jgi:hypothetical protein
MLRRMVFCGLFSLSMLAQQNRPSPPATTGPFQISGTLVDFVTSEPLSNARVAIAPATQRNAFTTIVTADDGRFFFSGLVPGKYTLTAQRRGYLTQSFNQHDGYSSSIVVGPELESNNLVFRLVGESAVSGTVTDEQGDSVRNAQVMLFQNMQAGGARMTYPRATSTTDDEGFYRFGHLPAGKYFVAVSAEPWYAQHYSPPAVAYTSSADTVVVPSEEPQQSPLDVAYPVTFYRGGTDAATATAIVLGKGEQVSIDISLFPVPALHVRITTENPEQDRQAYISLDQKLFDGARIGVRTQTIQVAPGATEIVGIPPGRYNMRINNSGKEPQTQEREVEIGGNGDLENSRGSTRVPVTATVHFESLAPAGQMSILLRAKKSTQVFNERVDAKGEAEFKQGGVPPGTYEISLQGQGPFIKSISATGARVTGRTLEIKDGGPVKLVLETALGEGTITGTALRGDKPVAGAMVVLVPNDPGNNLVLFRRDQSDSDGTFLLANAVPGHYTVVAIEDGWDLEWGNPDVLNKFMPQGEVVVVERHGKYSVKVKVQ